MAFLNRRRESSALIAEALIVALLIGGLPGGTQPCFADDDSDDLGSPLKHWDFSSNVRLLIFCEGLDLH